MTQAGPLFTRGDGVFVPSLATAGPWRPDAMHGGPPGALVGLLVEEAMEADEHVARLNVDLERPVPLLPLAPVVTRRTVSRRVAKLDIELRAEGDVAVRAMALLLRGGPIDVRPEGTALTVVGPERCVTWGMSPAHGAPLCYSRDSIEMRKVTGGFGDPLPTVTWIRHTSPVIADEPTGGLADLMSIADFGSPLSQSATPELTVALINTDISISLFRHPVGPWFLLSASRHLSPEGIGLAVTEVSDVRGPLGVLTQSQLVQPFGGRPLS